jgi:ATP adenylyltransferase
MEVLWASWRSKYVQGFKDETNYTNDNPCFICHAVNSNNDKDLLIVARREKCVVLLNKFPYNGGHLLVAPLRHVADLEELSDDELLEMMKTVKLSTKVLSKVSNPHGFNIGINLGRVSGAGLPGHIHIHVVPRWNGDTSFMSVLSDTKVVSQSLEESQIVLENAFRELS